MIGKETGEMLDFTVRSGVCQVCQIHERAAKVPDNECVKNWTGSSKAMEPDMAVEPQRGWM